MTEAKTVVADPALGFSYQIVLDKDARRTLVFQAHVSVDTPVEKLNECLDKIGKASDRQIALYELQEARQFLEDHRRQGQSLAVQKESLEALARARYEEKGYKGDWTPDKLPPQEKSARHNIEVSIERYREGAEKYAKVIARCEGLVNGYAHVSADSHPGQPGS